MNNEDRNIIDKIKQPFVELTEKEKKNGIKPIYFESEVINSEDRYIINKLTDGGKYVISGMLYVNMKGVELFTDIDSDILVDKKQGILVVKPSTIVDNIEAENEDTPEERQYVILKVAPFTEDDNYTWEALIGRLEAYKYIQNNIEDIDPQKSLILTNKVKLEDALTIEEFVKALQNAGVVDDEFDIDEYIYQGW